jgi:uncharacterized protein YacL
MSLRGFKIVSILAMTMGLIVSLLATAQGLVRLFASPNATPIDQAMVPVALAFLAIGAIAEMARKTFQAQADQIASLERRLTEAHAPLSGR